MSRNLLLPIFSALLLAMPILLRAQLPPPRQTIVCFGDSLTAGYGAPQGHGYPEYLESDLIAQGLHPRVINAGVDGDTTKDGLARVASVVAMHPDIVVLEFGANDGMRGQPVPGIIANLTRLIETLQKTGARIVLAGIYMPPNYGPEYVKQFDSIYSSLARKYKLPLMPFILKDVYGKANLVSGDQIHPNSDGYEVIARGVLPYVVPLVNK